MTANPPDPKDPWTVANGNKYDVDRFYTRSSDSKGHSNNIQTPISPALFGEIAMIIQSGAISEYRTMQDFVRDSLIHRAKYVADMIRSASLNRVIDSEIVIAQLDRMKAKRESNRTALNKAKEELQEKALDDDMVGMADVLMDLRDLKMAIEEPYRSRMEELVEQYERTYGARMRVD